MPPQERRHEGFLVLWGGVVAVWTEGDCEGEGLTTGVVRHACRLRRDGTRRFLVWGILLRLDWEPLREHVLAAGAASHACRRGSGSTRGFNFLLRAWGFFCGWTGSRCGGMCWPVDRPATHAAAGAAARGVLFFSLVCLVPVVRAYVAGACVGRRTGQPRMPPRERLHEGLGGDWGIVSHSRCLGTTQRGRGAVAVCFEGCCGSMCWPVDRPATHAAAGAAARGF